MSEPVLTYARALRRAIRDRDEALEVALEAYDLATTTIERLEATTIFLRSTRVVDELYSAQVKAADHAYTMASRAA